MNSFSGSILKTKGTLFIDGKFQTREMSFDFRTDDVRIGLYGPWLFTGSMPDFGQHLVIELEHTYFAVVKYPIVSRIESNIAYTYLEIACSSLELIDPTAISSRYTYHIHNLYFSGNDFFRSKKIPMSQDGIRLKVKGKDLVIRKDDEYKNIVDNFHYNPLAKTTAYIDIDASQYVDRKDAEEFVDNVCQLLSIACANSITYKRVDGYHGESKNSYIGYHNHYETNYIFSPSPVSCAKNQDTKHIDDLYRLLMFGMNNVEFLNREFRLLALTHYFVSMHEATFSEVSYQLGCSILETMKTIIAENYQAIKNRYNPNFPDPWWIRTNPKKINFKHYIKTLTDILRIDMREYYTCNPNSPNGKDNWTYDFLKVRDAVVHKGDFPAGYSALDRYRETCRLKDLIAKIFIRLLRTPIGIRNSYTHDYIYRF